MYEIATCKDPFDGAAPTAVAVMVVRDKARPLIPEDTDLPEEYNELMTNCWEQEPADRPDFQEIVSRLQVLTHSSSKSREGGDDDASFYSKHEDLSRRGESTRTGSGTHTGREMVEFGAEIGVPAPQGSMALGMSVFFQHFAHVYLTPPATIPVFSDIFRAAGLWEANPAAMKEVIKKLFCLTKKKSTKTKYALVH